MIYKIPTKEANTASKLVHLPDCDSMTQLQMCKLHGTEKSIPSWLPSIPRDTKGKVAYLLLCVLACMAVVLVASEMLHISDDLHMTALVTAMTILCIQVVADTYRSYVVAFNKMLKHVLVPGIDIDESILFDALRHCDVDVFNRSVDLMTDGNSSMGFGVVHCINEAIDDYINEAMHIAMSFYTKTLGTNLPEEDTQEIYQTTLDTLQPYAQQCIDEIEMYILKYDESPMYM